MPLQEIQKSIKGTASTLAKTVVGEEAEEGPYMFECLTCSLIQVNIFEVVVRQGIHTILDFWTPTSNDDRRYL